jgi:hypothetical protein
MTISCLPCHGSSTPRRWHNTESEGLPAQAPRRLELRPYVRTCESTAHEQAVARRRRLGQLFASQLGRDLSWVRGQVSHEPDCHEPRPWHH